MKINGKREDKVTEGKIKITDHKEENPIFNHEIWPGLKQLHSWNKAAEAFDKINMDFFNFYNRDCDTTFCHSNSEVFSKVRNQIWEDKRP